MSTTEVIFSDFILAIFVLLTIVIPAANLMGKSTQGKGGKIYLIIVACLYVGGLVISHDALLTLVAMSIFILGVPLSLINKSKGYDLAKSFLVTSKGSAPGTISSVTVKETISDNGVVTTTTNTTVVDGKVDSATFTPANIDYSIMDENAFINGVIDEELKKNNIPQDITISGIEKRRRTSYIILSIAIFIATSLVFFHMSLLFIIGLVVAGFILFKILTNLNLKKYLIKQIKARPDENFSNIITSSIQDRVEKKNYMIFIFIAILLPMAIFFKPHIFYEKTGEGYYVRFYTMGLSNMTEATIPEEHNGLKVIGLRGNAFSNMFFLNKVTLPNTITEIRGSAFENCMNLKEVKLPDNLKELGGSAFKGSGIVSINLPDSLKELHGETFKDCKNLKSVKLPNEILEIRGNTFENCISLESITIPDSVTRIGGHAFYNNRSLTTVNLTENSRLKEIGSSAFRLCDNLMMITIPTGTYINERAFKESPTIVNYFDNKTIYK